VNYANAIQAAYDGFAKGDPGPLFGLFDTKTECTEAEGFPYAGQVQARGVRRPPHQPC
jgi:hypothetical protein